MALFWIEVIPLAGAQPLLATFGREDQLSRSDNTDILRLVAMRVDDGASWIRRKEHIAAIRCQAIGFEGAFEPRK